MSGSTFSFPWRSREGRRVARILPHTFGTSGRYTILLTMLALVGFTSLLYASTFASIINVWRTSNTFAHGFVILPISAFIIWQKRGVLHVESARPSLAGFGFLTASVLVWLLASTANVQVGMHLAFIAIICTSIWSVLGTATTKTIRFPLMFAFFAVPFGEFLIPPLMAWTALFTVWALTITGIPVYLEGYFFSLPSGNFEVIEACSGINFLIVTVVLGIVFAYERFRTLRGRLIFVLSAMAVMIVANGVRAYVVVLAAHFSGMKYGAGADHIYFGWVLFSLVIFLTFWVGARLSGGDESAFRPSAGEAPRPENSDGGKSSSMILWAIAACAVIALGPLAQQIAHSQPRGTASQSYLPHATGLWTGPRPLQLTYRPDFRKGSQVLEGGYLLDSGLVEVHATVFAEQGQGNELIGWENKIFDTSRWRLAQRTDEKTIRLDDGRDLHVNRLVLTDSSSRLLLWYWYDIGGWRTTSRVKAKFYHAVQKVSGHNNGDALLVLATPVSQLADGQDSDRLRMFLGQHLDQLNSCLRMERESPAICSTRQRQVW